MTEAVKAVVEWARCEHAIERLCLITHPHNLASQRVAKGADTTGFIGYLAAQPEAAAETAEMVAAAEGWLAERGRAAMKTAIWRVATSMAAYRAEQDARFRVVARAIRARAVAAASVQEEQRRRDKRERDGKGIALSRHIREGQFPDVSPRGGALSCATPDVNPGRERRIRRYGLGP